jgi:large subunit ribosomal protein L5
MASRIATRYGAEIAPALMKEFGYGNAMQVPRLVKVVINVGLGEAIQNPKAVEACQTDITSISGQKAVITRARKSIATFKLRQGLPIGCMVTLRRDRMYEFFDRLVNVALPRVRDFKGISPKGFDGQGNFTMGVREQIIFPEIDYDKVDKIRGMNVTFVTSANTDDEAFALLKHLGLPFRK